MTETLLLVLALSGAVKTEDPNYWDGYASSMVAYQSVSHPIAAASPYPTALTKVEPLPKPKPKQDTIVRPTTKPPKEGIPTPPPPPVAQEPITCNDKDKLQPKTVWQPATEAKPVEKIYPWTAIRK